MKNRMTASEHWKHELSKNLQRQCAVEGCTEKRDRIAKYCRYHLRKQRTFGSPLGRVVRKHEYKWERAIAADFVEEHQDHPAIKLAQRYLQTWIDDGVTSSYRLPANRALRRLYDHGVTSQALLSECAALWLHDQIRGVFKSKDEMIFALGGLVFWAAPVPFKKYTTSVGTTKWKYQKVPTTTKKKLGSDIHSMLSPVLINISRAILKREEEKNQEKRELLTPF